MVRHRRRETQGSFQAVLQRLDGKPLGLILAGTPGSKGLVIIHRGESEVLCRWNEEHPHRRIDVGSAILSVNHLTEPSRMLQEFRQATSVDLKIKTTLDHQQELLFQAALKQHRDVQQARQRLRILDTETLPVSEPCSICFEQMNPQHHEVAVLPCHHHFHHQGVGKWLTQGKQCCPLCREQLA
mmetsp:Transcript_78867/g.160258  ORF Transcript_78867/g.160258 Transcript_78867/m.160258 type:complete len:184 (+) Transcript_78867:42-593(+)